jgi:hypothetical protein
MRAGGRRRRRKRPTRRQRDAAKGDDMVYIDDFLDPAPGDFLRVRVVDADAYVFYGVQVSA